MCPCRRTACGAWRVCVRWQARSCSRWPRWSRKRCWRASRGIRRVLLRDIKRAEEAGPASVNPTLVRCDMPAPPPRNAANSVPPSATRNARARGKETMSRSPEPLFANAARRTEVALSSAGVGPQDDRAHRDRVARSSRWTIATEGELWKTESDGLCRPLRVFLLAAAATLLSEGCATASARPAWKSHVVRLVGIRTPSHAAEVLSQERGYDDHTVRVVPSPNPYR
jgi:hypothetical protein